MSTLRQEQNVIAIRSPDDFLSGFLCITFAAAYHRSDAQLDTFPEQENTWYLVGVTSGSIRVTCEAGCLLLSSGQALAVYADAPMDLLFHGQCDYALLCLKGSWAGEILRRSDSLGGSVYPQGAAVLSQAMAQLLSAGEEASAQYASGVAYQALMALYGTGSIAVKAEKQLPQTVEAALKIIQQDFAFLYGIGDLAQRLQVSQEYLTRCFREHVGMTPGKYLVQVRVEQAKLLLQHSDHSIAFVADACGFANSNYFARVFRSIVGVTPSVYARDHADHSPKPHATLDSIYVL